MKKVNELNALTKMIDEVKAKSEEVRKRRIDEFFKGLLFISDKLKEMYRMLSFDGDAHLELVDSFDPYSEGVTFNVRPPRKTWRNIINLSGGEKTLASMALIFALHQFKPSPLYVMDEIDAALDFRNVSIIGNYIKVCRIPIFRTVSRFKSKISIQIFDQILENSRNIFLISIEFNFFLAKNEQYSIHRNIVTRTYV